MCAGDKGVGECEAALRLGLEYTLLPERLRGLDIIRTSGKKRGQPGKANDEVIRALAESGNLLARGVTTICDISTPHAGWIDTLGASGMLMRGAEDSTPCRRGEEPQRVVPEGLVWAAT